jgi:hypothetical protein
LLLDRWCGRLRLIAVVRALLFGHEKSP